MKKLLPIAIVAASIVFASCGKGSKIGSEISLYPVKSGPDFEYVDQEGKIVINPQFSSATVFREGVALVRTSGDNPKWGYIGEDGKYTITANYKHATVFSDGLAWVVSENSAPTAITTSGEIKITLQDAEVVRIFSEGLAAFAVTDTSGTKWGFVDKTGKIKINPQFSSTGDFSDGKCAVANKEGKWGYIDAEGKIVINFQFDLAREFDNGTAVVFSGQKAGVIDANGKYSINPQFTDMIVDGDRYLVNSDGKWGWCDNNGKLIINPQFRQAFPFGGHDLASVQSGDTYGFIDKEGKIVVNPQFDLAYPFSGKLAMVKSGGKYGFVDEEGKYVINPQFDDCASDVGIYMLTGETEYAAVETDYFNIESISSRINIEAPEGLSIGNTFADVMTKLKKTESDFRLYGTEHQVLNNERLTKEAAMTFTVFGNASKEVADGWFTRRVFNPEAQITGFQYSISLGGKGSGKGKDLMTSLQKKLVGYTKDDQQTTDRVTVYKKGDVTVSCYSSDSQVMIRVSKEAPAANEEGE